MSNQERNGARLEGRVKWFSRDKGYGFIHGDDGVERYFGVRDVRGVDLPANGDFVEFDHEAARKGPRAIGVSLVARVAKEPGPGRVCCQSCGKAMVPRVIFHRGEPEKSICPFCGNLHMDFRKGCFIATAVYGDPAAPEVDALRYVRDYQLLPTTTGRAFVRLYYRLSPPIAAVLLRSPASAKLVRRTLDRLVDWMFREQR